MTDFKSLLQAEKERLGISSWSEVKLPEPSVIEIKSMWESKMLMAGCTEDETKYELSDYKQENSKQNAIVTDVMKNLKSSYVFEGNNGTGKSHLAILVLKHRLMSEDIWRPKYVTLFKLQSELMADFMNMSDVVEAYAEHDILIIDEMDKPFKTNKENECMALSELVDLRHRNKKQTIFITNRLDAMVEYMTSAAVDRIKEKCVIKTFDWQSYRRAK